MSNPKIIIVLNGGVITHVLSNSPDIEVIVKDYDIEGLDDSQLETDASGDSFFLTQDTAVHRPDLVNEFFKEYAQ